MSLTDLHKPFGLRYRRTDGRVWYEWFADRNQRDNALEWFGKHPEIDSVELYDMPQRVPCRC